MSRYALDANILLYAELERHSAKGTRAAQVIKAVAGRGVLAAQVLGAYLNVVRRRAPTALVEARRQAAAYREVFVVVPTEIETILAAAQFAERYRMQFWDSVIWQASRSGGASTLFSEDLQDGFEAEGLRAIDPFRFSDWHELEHVIAG